MKTNSEISKLAEFENELETLNNSEMKGIVGGLETVVVYGYPSSYYSSYNYSYYSQYYSQTPSLPQISAPTGSGGSGSSSPAPSPSPEQEEECKDQLESDVKSAVAVGGIVGGVVGTVAGVFTSPAGGFLAGSATSMGISGYMVSRANANYSSCMGN